MNPPFVDIHSHQPPFPDEGFVLACVRALADRAPSSHSARLCTGIHPWDAANPDCALRFERIRDLVETKRLSALGESGFDRSRRSVPIPDQSKWFRAHAQLAETAHLPLILHSVNSHSDILSEFVKFRPRSPWLVHGFWGGIGELDQILSKGIAVSFGPRELARIGAAARLERVPPDLFFLETDDSGEPIEKVYRMAADVLAMPPEKIAEWTRSNWRRWFGD